MTDMFSNFVGFASIVYGDDGSLPEENSTIGVDDADYTVLKVINDVSNSYLISPDPQPSVA